MGINLLSIILCSFIFVLITSILTIRFIIYIISIKYNCKISFKFLKYHQLAKVHIVKLNNEKNQQTSTTTTTTATTATSHHSTSIHENSSNDTNSKLIEINIDTIWFSSCYLNRQINERIILCLKNITIDFYNLSLLNTTTSNSNESATTNNSNSNSINSNNNNSVLILWLIYFYCKYTGSIKVENLKIRFFNSFETNSNFCFTLSHFKVEIKNTKTQPPSTPTPTALAASQQQQINVNDASNSNSNTNTFPCYHSLLDETNQNYEHQPLFNNVLDYNDETNNNNISSSSSSHLNSNLNLIESKLDFENLKNKNFLGLETIKFNFESLSFKCFRCCKKTNKDTSSASASSSWSKQTELNYNSDLILFEFNVYKIVSNLFIRRRCYADSNSSGGDGNGGVGELKINKFNLIRNYFNNKKQNNDEKTSISFKNLISHVEFIQSALENTNLILNLFVPTDQSNPNRNNQNGNGNNSDDGHNDGDDSTHPTYFKDYKYLIRYLNSSDQTRTSSQNENLVNDNQQATTNDDYDFIWHLISKIQFFSIKNFQSKFRLNSSNHSHYNINSANNKSTLAGASTGSGGCHSSAHNLENNNKYEQLKFGQFIYCLNENENKSLSEFSNEQFQLNLNHLFILFKNFEYCRHNNNNNRNNNKFKLLDEFIFVINKSADVVTAVDSDLDSLNHRKYEIFTNCQNANFYFHLSFIKELFNSKLISSLNTHSHNQSQSHSSGNIINDSTKSNKLIDKLNRFLFPNKPTGTNPSSSSHRCRPSTDDYPQQQQNNIESNKQIYSFKIKITKSYLHLIHSTSAIEQRHRQYQYQHQYQHQQQQQQHHQRLDLKEQQSKFIYSFGASKINLQFSRSSIDHNGGGWDDYKESNLELNIQNLILFKSSIFILSSKYSKIGSVTSSSGVGVGGGGVTSSSSTTTNRRKTNENLRTSPSPASTNNNNKRRRRRLHQTNTNKFTNNLFDRRDYSNISTLLDIICNKYANCDSTYHTHYWGNLFSINQFELKSKKLNEKSLIRDVRIESISVEYSLDSILFLLDNNNNYLFDVYFEKLLKNLNLIDETNRTESSNRRLLKNQIESTRFKINVNCLNFYLVFNDHLLNFQATQFHLDYIRRLNDSKMTTKSTKRKTSTKTSTLNGIHFTINSLNCMQLKLNDICQNSQLNNKTNGHEHDHDDYDNDDDDDDEDNDGNDYRTKFYYYSTSTFNRHHHVHHHYNSLSLLNNKYKNNNNNSNNTGDHSHDHEHNNFEMLNYCMIENYKEDKNMFKSNYNLIILLKKIKFDCYNYKSDGNGKGNGNPDDDDDDGNQDKDNKSELIKANITLKDIMFTWSIQIYFILFQTLFKPFMKFISKMNNFNLANANNKKKKKKKRANFKLTILIESDILVNFLFDYSQDSSKQQTVLAKSSNSFVSSSLYSSAYTSTLSQSQPPPPTSSLYPTAAATAAATHSSIQTVSIIFLNAYLMISTGDENVSLKFSDINAFINADDQNIFSMISNSDHLSVNNFQKDYSDHNHHHHTPTPTLTTGRAGHSTTSTSTSPPPPLNTNNNNYSKEIEERIEKNNPHQRKFFHAKSFHYSKSNHFLKREKLKFERKLLNTKCDTNKLVEIKFETFFLNFIYNYDFAKLIDHILNLRKCLILINKEISNNDEKIKDEDNKTSRTSLSSSDLILSINKFDLIIEDDPFEVKLAYNYALMVDEHSESIKRMQTLEQRRLIKEQHLEKEAIEILKERESIIYLKRSQMIYGGSSGSDAGSAAGTRSKQKSTKSSNHQDNNSNKPNTIRTQLFTFSANNVELYALVDSDWNGKEKCYQILRKIDKFSPPPPLPTPSPINSIRQVSQPIEHTDSPANHFCILWCRHINLAIEELKFVFRDYTQPLLKINRFHCAGKIVGAEYEPVPRSIREVKISLGHGLDTFNFSIQRNMSPFKIYHDLNSKMNSFSFAYGPCWEGCMAQLNLSLDKIIHPARDPSRPMPWWDKSRLYLHGRFTAQVQKYQIIYHVSMDPYNRTEEMKWVWSQFYFDWTNMQMILNGNLDVYLNTESKYDDCRILHLPNLEIKINIEWITRSQSNNHHASSMKSNHSSSKHYQPTTFNMVNGHNFVMPCAPDKLPIIVNSSEHDSYAQFRSENVNLTFSFVSCHLDNDQPAVAGIETGSTLKENQYPTSKFYASTSRFLQRIKDLLNAITRPTRRGKLFGNLKPRKPVLSRHFKIVKLNFDIKKLNIIYWSSASEEYGVKLECDHFKMNSTHKLELMPFLDKLKRRPKPCWSIELMRCQLTQTSIYLMAPSKIVVSSQNTNANSSSSYSHLPDAKYQQQYHQQQQQQNQQQQHQQQFSSIQAHHEFLMLETNERSIKFLDSQLAMRSFFMEIDSIFYEREKDSNLSFFHQSNGSSGYEIHRITSSSFRHRHGHRRRHNKTNSSSLNNSFKTIGAKSITTNGTTSGTKTRNPNSIYSSLKKRKYQQKKVQPVEPNENETKFSKAFHKQMSLTSNNHQTSLLFNRSHMLNTSISSPPPPPSVNNKQLKHLFHGLDIVENFNLNKRKIQSNNSLLTHVETPPTLDTLTNVSMTSLMPFQVSSSMPKHNIQVRNLKAKWNNLNRDVIYILYEIYNKAKRLRHNISTNALKEYDMLTDQIIQSFATNQSRYLFQSRHASTSQSTPPPPPPPPQTLFSNSISNENKLMNDSTTTTGTTSETASEQNINSKKPMMMTMMMNESANRLLEYLLDKLETEKGISTNIYCDKSIIDSFNYDDDSSLYGVHAASKMSDIINENIFIEFINSQIKLSLDDMNAATPTDKKNNMTKTSFQVGGESESNLKLKKQQQQQQQQQKQPTQQQQQQQSYSLNNFNSTQTDYLIISAGKAKVVQRVHKPMWKSQRLLDKTSWSGYLEKMQYFATLKQVANTEDVMSNKPQQETRNSKKFNETHQIQNLVGVSSNSKTDKSNSATLLSRSNNDESVVNKNKTLNASLVGGYDQIVDDQQQQQQDVEEYWLSEDIIDPSYSSSPSLISNNSDSSNRSMHFSFDQTKLKNNLEKSTRKITDDAKTFIDQTTATMTSRKKLLTDHKSFNEMTKQNEDNNNLPVFCLNTNSNETSKTSRLGMLIASNQETNFDLINQHHKPKEKINFEIGHEVLAMRTGAVNSKIPNTSSNKTIIDNITPNDINVTHSKKRNDHSNLQLIVSQCRCEFYMIDFEDRIPNGNENEYFGSKVNGISISNSISSTHLLNNMNLNQLSNSMYSKFSQPQPQSHSHHQQQQHYQNQNYYKAVNNTPQTKMHNTHNDKELDSGTNNQIDLNASFNEPIDCFSLIHYDLNLCTNSQQYKMIMDIVNNLVLYFRPQRKQVTDKQKSIKFNLQLSMGDMDSLKKHIQLKQTEVKHLLFKIRLLERKLYYSREKIQNQIKELNFDLSHHQQQQHQQQQQQQTGADCVDRETDSINLKLIYADLFNTRMRTIQDLKNENMDMEREYKEYKKMLYELSDELDISISSYKELVLEKRAYTLAAAPQFVQHVLLDKNKINKTNFLINQQQPMYIGGAGGGSGSGAGGSSTFNCFNSNELIFLNSNLFSRSHFVDKQITKNDDFTNQSKTYSSMLSSSSSSSSNQTNSKLNFNNAKNDQEKLYQQAQQSILNNEIGKRFEIWFKHIQWKLNDDNGQTGCAQFLMKNFFYTKVTNQQELDCVEHTLEIESCKIQDLSSFDSNPITNPSPPPSSSKNINKKNKSNKTTTTKQTKLKKFDNFVLSSLYESKTTRHSTDIYHNHHHHINSNNKSMFNDTNDGGGGVGGDDGDCASFNYDNNEMSNDAKKLSGGGDKEKLFNQINNYYFLKNTKNINSNMIRVYCKERPPVGIPVIEHLELNVSPLSIKLTNSFYKMMMKFFFDHQLTSQTKPTSNNTTNQQPSSSSTLASSSAGYQIQNDQTNIGMNTTPNKLDHLHLVTNSNSKRDKKRNSQTFNVDEQINTNNNSNNNKSGGSKENINKIFSHHSISPSSIESSTSSSYKASFLSSTSQMCSNNATLISSNSKANMHSVGGMGGGSNLVQVYQPSTNKSILTKKSSQSSLFNNLLNLNGVQNLTNPSNPTPTPPTSNPTNNYINVDDNMNIESKLNESGLRSNATISDSTNNNNNSNSSTTTTKKLNSKDNINNKYTGFYYFKNNIDDDANNPDNSNNKDDNNMHSIDTNNTNDNSNNNNSSSSNNNNNNSNSNSNNNSNDHFLRNDDIEIMKQRSANNITFLCIKIPEIQLLVSYKANKDKNIKDLKNVGLIFPLFEIHDQTWTWLDLINALKTHVKKALLSQAIKHKLIKVPIQPVNKLLNKTRRSNSQQHLTNLQIDEHEKMTIIKLFGTKFVEKSQSLISNSFVAPPPSLPPPPAMPAITFNTGKNFKIDLNESTAHKQKPTQTHDSLTNVSPSNFINSKSQTEHSKLEANKLLLMQADNNLENEISYLTENQTKPESSNQNQLKLTDKIKNKLRIKSKKLKSTKKDNK